MKGDIRTEKYRKKNIKEDIKRKEERCYKDNIHKLNEYV